MASEGPRSAGTGVDDDSIGTTTWSTPENITIHDSSRASLSGSGSGWSDTTVKIVKSDASIGTENKGTSTIMPGTPTYIIYGGAADLWTESWSDTDINDIDFGVVISCTEVAGSSTVSHYLKGTNFGFSIPGGATIDGIKAEIEQQNASSRGTAIGLVDHIRITVYYTEAAGGTNMQINIGDVWKEVALMKINIGDVWKDVASAKINIGDVWKDIF